MKRLFTSILFILFFVVSRSQSYTMGTQQISTCSGTLYDDGGASQNYLPNQHHVMTICSSNPAGQVQLLFNLWDIQSPLDLLYVYDGSDTLAPLLGVYSDGVFPNILTSTNTNRCLTLVFTSANSLFPAQGWDATISCVPNSSIGSADSCANATPYCSGLAFNYAANYSTIDPGAGNGNPAQVGPDYDCLTNQPNPSWFYFKVDTSGNLKINISSKDSAGGTHDVDFICWGPFTSPTAPCASQLTAGNVDSCSYSIATAEVLSITGAVAGNYYLLMVTNFANVPTNISLKFDTNSTAQIDNNQCISKACNIVSLSAKSVGCVGDTAYTAELTIITKNKPTTGTLVIQSPTGTTTLSAPFADTIVTTIPNIPSSYLSKDTFDVYFSSDTFCKSRVFLLPTVYAGPDRNFCVGNDPIGVTVLGKGPFHWSPTTGIVSANADSSIIEIVPTATQTYIVTGDSASTCKFSDTINVNLLPAFTVTASGVDTICLNASTSLNVNVTSTTGTAPFLYSWKDNNGTSIGAANSISVTPQVTTTYNIEVYSSEGCLAIDSHTIVVNGIAPKVRLTSDKNFVCPGQTIAINTAISTVNCGLTPGGAANACPAGSSFISQTVGTGTSSATTTSPYFNFWEDRRVQYLFKATELQALGLFGGTITDLSFFITNKASSIAYDGFTIKMGCTSLNALTTTFVGGLQTVVNPNSYTSFAGANPHILDNPYDWDGYSNLIVEVCYNNAGWTSSDAVQYTPNVFTGATLTDFDADIDGCTLPTGTLSADRPNITFGMCNPPATAYTFNWSALSGNSPLSCTNCQNPTVNLMDDGVYQLHLSDPQGCTNDMSINLFVNPDVKITAGNDVNLSCGAAPTQLNVVQVNPSIPVCVAGYTVSSIPYLSKVPSSAVTTVTWPNGTGDDGSSPVISLPFSFNYYCQTYSNLIVSTNGYIVMGTTTPPNGTYGTPAIPATATPNNMIALSKEDLDVRTIGSVTTFTSGIAPNRIFVIKWNGVPHYNQTSQLVSGEIQLFEGTNLIEIHTLSNNSTFTHIQGVENSTGTSATATPGRNSQAWQVSSPDAYRFTPQTSAVSITSYNWTPATTLSSATIANPMATPTASTCYDAAVTFSNGCVVHDTVCLNIASFPHSLTVSPDTICPGDTAQLNFVGAGVTYSWSPTGNLSNAAIANPLASVINTTDFYVSATDASGCLALDTITLNVRPNVPVVLRADTNVCPGDSLSITVPGGPYLSYAWYSLATGNTVLDTSSSITVQPDNSYYVRVQLPTGCAAYSDTFTIGHYILGQLKTPNDTAICIGSSLTLNADPTVTNILWSTGITTASIVASTAGDYYYSATDTNGCRLYSDTTQLTINALPVLTMSVASNPVCPNDPAVLDAGSIPGVTYTWNPGSIVAPTITVFNSGQYDVTASINGCTATDFINVTMPVTPIITLPVADATICPTDSFLIPISGGTYSSYEWYSASTGNIVALTAAFYGKPVDSFYVRVKDANGCTFRSDTFGVYAKTVATLLPLGNPSFCQGDSATLLGTAGLTNYVWTPGNETTQDLTVKTSGQYSYTALSNGCAVQSTIATVTVTPNPVITFNTFKNPLCPGDVATVDAGLVPSVIYTWNPGGVTPSISVSTSGQYDVTASINGCTATDFVNVTVTTAPVLNLPATDATVCPLDSFLIPLAGGTFNSYEWYSASTGIIKSTKNTFYGKPVDSFYVKVTDANGCSFKSDTFGVYAKIVAPLLTLSNQAICQGDSVDLLGTPGLSGYVWTPGNETTQDINVKTSGQYSYTALSNGCAVQSNVATVTVNPLPIITFSVSKNPFCNGDTVIIGAGALPNTSYTWSTTNTQDSILVTVAGIYSVTATSNGCTAADQTTITLAQKPVISFPADTTTCACKFSANIVASVQNYTSPLNFNWSANSTTDTTTKDTLQVTETGVYSLTVTDANQCKDTATYTANIWCLAIDAQNDGNSTINSGETTSLKAVVVNSNYTPTLSYVWQPGLSLSDSLIQNPKANPTVTTTYIVYVTDATHNCSAFDTVSITVNPPGLFAIPTGFTPNGDGQNDYFYPYFPVGSSASVVGMRIYNRWGQLVYNGPNNPGWDGKVNGVDAPVDTYTYYLEIAVPDANAPSGVTNIIKAGSFAVIR